MIRPEMFLPPTIRIHEREKPWTEWKKGTVLFADVSGFTSMAEALAVLGPEGGEILSELMNRYFHEMISIVKSHSGEVIKFAGDSIFCFFNGKQAFDIALQTGAEMQAAIRKFQEMRTPIRKFSLQMKIGLGAGQVLFAGVGDSSVRCDFLFAGKAVDLACKAEYNASPGQIVLASSFPPPKIKHFRFTAEKAGFYLVRPNKIEHGDRNQNNYEEPTWDKGMAAYLIQEVYEMLHQGYQKYVEALQTVVTAFLSFSGFDFTPSSFNALKFQKFFNTVVGLIHEYDGRLNSVTSGDKGCSFFLHFGAPNRLEKKEENACQWALDVQKTLSEEFPEISIKIGMTEGRVFSGIVGGAGSLNYTVVGDSVNLAARLMQIASEKSVLVNQSFQDKCSRTFQFSAAGSKELKGKKEQTAVYELKERTKTHFSQNTEQGFSGRKSELQKVLSALEASGSGDPKFVVLEGDAGIGKSFLASHICEIASGRGWEVFSGKSEITRRSYAYAPWLSLFRSALFERGEPSLEELKNLLHSSNLSDYLSWHAEFFELHAQAKTEKYDETTRKTVFHHQLSLVLLNKIGKRRVILFLDDLHWFDSLSLDLLNSLLNHMKDQRILLLAAGRPEWKRESFIKRTNCHLVRLSQMDASAVRDQAAQVLQGNIRDSFLEYIMRETAGTPFFVIELIRYLQGKNLLVRIAGDWAIRKEATFQQSLSGEEIIVGRADQLSLPEKILLQSAACMGPTFSISVLKRVLGKQYEESVFQSLQEQGYFQNLQRGWESFSHALMQEALYNSISKKMRKDIHARVAVAMQDMFGKRAQKFYPNLANHFRLGGMREEAIDYAMKAGEQLYRSFSFPESRFYFDHAFQLMKGSRDERKWKIGLKLAGNLIHTGEIKESLRLTKNLRERARRLRFWDYYYQSCALQFDAMYKLSDYSYLPFGIRLLHKARKVPQNVRAQLYYLVGANYFWQGYPDKAERYLLRAVRDGDRSKYKETLLSSHHLLSCIASERGQIQEAYRRIQRALSVARNIGSLVQEIRIRREWAGMLTENNKPEESRKIQLELLPRAEAAGDFYMVAVILVGLAEAETKLQHWQKATEYLQEAIRLFSSLGIAQGKAKAIMWLGIISFYREDYRTAYDFYSESTRFFEETGELLEACHGYYNLAEVCLKLGKTSEASRWYQKGMKSFQPKNNPQLAQMFVELNGLLKGLEQ